MAVTVKQVFDAALYRAKHLLVLYDILSDTRSRGVRSDWYSSFCKVMHWPAGEQVVRIDGKDSNSLLVLRECLGLSRYQFQHEFVSELLRAAMSVAVSAMDRYFHDQVVDNVNKLLRLPEDQIPSRLKKLKIPVLTMKRSLEKLRRDGRSRPGTIIKRDVQKQLHREQTFQSISNVENAVQMLGIKDFWNAISADLANGKAPGDIQNELREIVQRRNQIVHEADIELQQRAREIKLRDINRSDAEQAITFIEEFIGATDHIVTKAL